MSNIIYTGLKWQHLITSQRPFKLRVDLTDASSQAGVAIYTKFTIGPPPNYVLQISRFESITTLSKIFLLLVTSYVLRTCSRHHNIIDLTINSMFRSLHCLLLREILREKKNCPSTYK